MSENRFTAFAAALCMMALAALACAEGAAPGRGSPALGPAADSPDANQTADCLAAVRAFGSRAEGSAAEAAAFDYIESFLRARGIETATTGFADAREGYSTSRIVEGRLPGSREDELAVLVPVSSWVDSRDPAEGAFGIALALGEAARLSSEARAGSVSPISFRFVFLGAEKRGKMAAGLVASLGTSTWLSRQAGWTRLAALYLDIGEEPSTIALRGAGKGVYAPYWLFEGARRALESSGIGYGLEANRAQAYRLGLASDYGPAAPYLETGMPAIELRGERGGASPPAAGTAPTWFGGFIHDFAEAEAGGFTNAWDRHYFIFQVGPKGLVLREETYVVFLVVLLAVVASSFLIATMTKRGATKQLLRRAPAIGAEVFALFLALALVFLVGKVIARLDASLLGSLDSWSLAPRVFAAARILSSFLLFLALLSFLVEKRALTPNPYFYELTALLCLAVDVPFFSAIDLSASFYFMWALIFVEASLAARNRWATLVAYALMYLPLLVIAGELSARPDLPTYERLIAPGYLGVLSLSALALPFFVFTASPLLFFAGPGTAARKKAVAVFAICALAIEAAALIYALAAAPLAGPGRKDLRITEAIDQDSGNFAIELSGRRRLGKGGLERGGETFVYDTLRDRATLKGEDRERLISVVATASPFLDRVDENIAIAFASPPYGVDIALESGKDILIYDSSLPYKVSVDGKSASIYAGVNPGKDLRVSLTVPSTFRSKLVVTARYLGHLRPYAQSSGAALEDDGLAVRASFDIGSGPR